MAERNIRHVIDALKRKAVDPGVTKEESLALMQKVKELEEKYDIKTTDEKVRKMSHEDFIRTFFVEPRSAHFTVFPVRSGQAFIFSWLANMTQEDPQKNEETWDIIQTDNPDY